MTQETVTYEGQVASFLFITLQSTWLTGSAKQRASDSAAELKSKAETGSSTQKYSGLSRID